MAALTEDQVRHIAKLARLKLGDDEVRLFATQLGDVLSYVRQLDALDVQSIEPLAHPLPITNRTRSDEPRDSLSREQALSNTPDTHDGLFKVPAVLESS